MENITQAKATAANLFTNFTPRKTIKPDVQKCNSKLMNNFTTTTTTTTTIATYP